MVVVAGIRVVISIILEVAKMDFGVSVGVSLRVGVWLRVGVASCFAVVFSMVVLTWVL